MQTIGWRWYADTITICGSIIHDQSMYYQMLTCCGKNSKSGKMRQMAKSLPKFCFCSMTEKVFCIRLLWMMRSGFTMIIPNAKSRGFYLVKYHLWLCLAFGGTNSVLKPRETVDGDRYQQQHVFEWPFTQKTAERNKRPERLKLQFENAPCYYASISRDTTRMLKYPLPHLPHSPGLATSDFHLLRSMAYGFASLHVTHFGNLKLVAGTVSVHDCCWRQNFQFYTQPKNPKTCAPLYIIINIF